MLVSDYLHRKDSCLKDMLIIIPFKQPYSWIRLLRLTIQDSSIFIKLQRQQMDSIWSTGIDYLVTVIWYSLMRRTARPRLGPAAKNAKINQKCLIIMRIEEWKHMCFVSASLALVSSCPEYIFINFCQCEMQKKKKKNKFLFLS